ncbi:poly(3-hydroxybutyrate) depolymerase [Janthinobacterium fluminis]|uniref:Poly(3-hydroxybutyrate) depolymerase n=1 Tax=Janthinobacterium fluminis TaxID=2987524 RepID=A0ABT5JYH7_9BURK|nr:poly(3-hydroxybutyrate) depolymerase [Janthinobacterium fluminis]MDC8757786.1 poly(3-hydroxybutyrate) depolymerase [Janthinobacterium fluminis]
MFIGRRAGGRSVVLLAAALAAAGLVPLHGQAKGADAVALPAFQADLRQTSVSGLSSGAFMAGQFAVAFSGTVAGAGIVAGGPYYCSGSPGMFPYIPYLTNAMSTCMNPAQAGVAPPSAATLWSAAQDFARNRAIDDTANVQRQRIYLFSGTQDKTVTQAVVDQTQLFYQLAGVPATQLRYVNNVDAGHAFITDKNSDLACPTTASPYINDCDLFQAKDILLHMYPDLKPPAAQLSGTFIKFNQRSFLHSPYSSMSNTAYVYVPKSCNTQSCRVHVAFHGCHQSAASIGERFYKGTGYNEVADTNNIIVLYPQVDASPVYPYNPNGCWDFWGYTSVNPFMPDFYRKSAMQMAAVKAMLDRLAAPRSAVHSAARRR